MNEEIKKNDSMNLEETNLEANENLLSTDDQENVAGGANQNEESLSQAEDWCGCNHFHL